MRNVLRGSLASHGRRYVASALAICLGVAFVAASLVVLTSAKAALGDTVGPEYRRASYVVTGALVEYPEDGTEPKAIEQLAGVPGVESVGPLAVTSLWFDGVGSLPVGALPTDPALQWPELTAGRAPRGPGEIALAARVAAEYDVRVGDDLAVDGGDRTHRARVVGVFTPGATPGSAEALATIDTLAGWGGAFADEILLRTSPDATTDELAAAVQTVFPGAELVTAQQRIDDAIKGQTRNLDVLGAFLIGFAAISVFVAVLVVANTFTVLLAQRVRELALLRCLGARRGQLLRSLLAEAGFLGLTASAVGVVLGYVLGAVALTVLGSLGVLVADTGVRVDPVATLVPVAVGVVATVIAALLPVWRATTVPPMAALRPAAAIRIRSRAGVVRLVSAAVLLALGGIVLARGADGGEGTEILVSVAGGALTFLGVLLLGPVIVPAVVRLQGLLVHVGGAPTGRLAVGNALRNPRRTAATATALLVGVTLITIMTVGAASVRATLNTALDEQYPVDLTVSAYDASAVPAPVRTALRESADVAASASLVALATDATIGELPVGVLGAEPEQLAEVVRDDAVTATFGAGTALIGPSLAQELAVGSGDELVVRTPEGRLSVRATVTPALASSYGLVVTTDELAALGKIRPAGEVWAQLRTDADVRAVVNELESLLRDVRGVDLGGGAPERARNEQMLEVMLLVAVGLLAIAVLIALVGVGNTLSLSVIERTRENALLRALGLRRGQLRRMIGLEALLLAGAAVVLGVPLGTVYGWLGTSALLGDLTEHVRLAVPVGQLVVIVAMAVGAGLLAAVLPARRAARIAPAAALAETG